MTRKTKKIKRDRANRARMCFKKSEDNTIEIFLRRGTDWLGDHPKSVTDLAYLAGVSFYSGLAALFGYSFLVIFGIFIGALIWCPVVLAVLAFYEETVCTSRIFYSPRSWFKWVMDFFEDNLELTIRYTWEITKEREDFLRIPMMALCIPMYFVVLALISSLLTVVLFLDWVRLLAIGFVNLCLAITPTRSPKKFLLASVIWAGIGIGIGTFFYDTSMEIFSVYCLFGIIYGGIVGICLALWKGAREMESRNGNPYFPT